MVSSLVGLFLWIVKAVAEKKRRSSKKVFGRIVKKKEGACGERTKRKDLDQRKRKKFPLLKMGHFSGLDKF